MGTDIFEFKIRASYCIEEEDYIDDESIQMTRYEAMPPHRNLVNRRYLSYQRVCNLVNRIFDQHEVQLQAKDQEIVELKDSVSENGCYIHRSKAQEINDANMAKLLQEIGRLEEQLANQGSCKGCAIAYTCKPFRILKNENLIGDENLVCKYYTKGE